MRVCSTETGGSAHGSVQLSDHGWLSSPSSGSSIRCGSQERQQRHRRRGLEHQWQRSVAPRRHAVPHNSGDGLREHFADCPGVRTPVATLHLQLLPGVALLVRLDGGPGGDAPRHAQRAVRDLGAGARLLPRLAVFRRDVLQCFHPQLVRHQSGPLPPHHLSAAIQTAHDPAPRLAAGGWGVGLGGPHFLPAHQDGLAQLGSRAGPFRTGSRQRHGPEVRFLLPAFVLPAFHFGNAIHAVSSPGDSSLRPGGDLSHLLLAVHGHLFHLLPNPAGGQETSEAGGGSNSPSVPAPLTRRTLSEPSRCPGRRRLQPPGSTRAAACPGEM